MAKFRKVHTSFWDDPLMEKINPDARYFYLFLITNPLCTECGIYQITIKKMCNYTGYNEDSIRSLIRVFEVENSRIVYDTSTEEICLLKKPNYIENTGKPVIDCLNSEFLNVKNKSLIIRQIKHIERESVKKIYDAWYVSYDVPSNKLGQEKEKEEEEKKKRREEEKEEANKNKIFDAEKEILENAIQFDRICYNANYTDKDAAKKSLRKFHLHLQKKETYPQTKTQVYAGFETWLLNEKNFVKNGKQGTGNVGKTIEFDKP